MSQKKMTITKVQPATKRMVGKKRPTQIPEFTSRENAAKFWDTHSLADYAEELTPVKAEFAESLSQGITVRFDPETLDELRTQARTKGVGPTTLIRMWILERLQGISSAR